MDETNKMSAEDIAFIEAELAHQEKEIMNLKGKHIKAALTRLERFGPVSKDTRKIVLDGFNDLTRDILRLLGYNVED
jgi:hypothetical protein